MVGARSIFRAIARTTARSQFLQSLVPAQAIGEEDLSGIDIAVVSDRLHSVQGEPVFDPVCATLLGPTKVIPKEFPGITCRSIDIDSSSQGHREARR